MDYIRHYTDFRTACIGFVMNVRPSILTYRVTLPPFDGFEKEINNLETKNKTVEKLQDLLNYDMANEYLNVVEHVCRTTLRRILLRSRKFSEGIRR